MKLDANVKITRSPVEDLLPTGTQCEIPIDEDYCSDWDDVIRTVEMELFSTYNLALTYNINFEISNAQELCDTLFN